MPLFGRPKEAVMMFPSTIALSTQVAERCKRETTLVNITVKTLLYHDDDDEVFGTGTRLVMEMEHPPPQIGLSCHQNYDGGRLYEHHHHHHHHHRRLFQSYSLTYSSLSLSSFQPDAIVTPRGSLSTYETCPRSFGPLPSPSPKSDPPAHYSLPANLPSSVLLAPLPNHASSFPASRPLSRPSRSFMHILK